MKFNTKCSSIIYYSCTNNSIGIRIKFESWRHRGRRWCLFWMQSTCKSCRLQSHMEAQCKYQSFKYKYTLTNRFTLPWMSVQMQRTQQSAMCLLMFVESIISSHRLRLILKWMNESVDSNYFSTTLVQNANTKMIRIRFERLYSGNTICKRLFQSPVAVRCNFRI